MAFVRAGGRETAHLLPVARRRAMLERMAENVRLARRARGPAARVLPVAGVTRTGRGWIVALRAGRWTRLWRPG